MQILQLFSRSPYRLSVTTDNAPTTNAGDYVVSRPDGAPIVVSVTNVWLTGPTTAELSLSPPLLPGIIYVLTLPNAPSAPSAQLSYQLPVISTPAPLASEEDPEAEALGVDLDWFADQLTSIGDTPSIRGRQCVVNDLQMIAFIVPSELAHRPNDGGNIKASVNAPSNSTDQVLAALKRQWSKDPRVKKNGIGIQVDASTVGQIFWRAQVQTIAIEDPLFFKAPGGAT